jgi:hypothetical protein
MTTDLLPSSWTDLDSAELRFILLERIGKPGQYDDRDHNPNRFYLPLAGSSCRIKLTFSDSKQIVAIEPGPRSALRARSADSAAAGGRAASSV